MKRFIVLTGLLIGVSAVVAGCRREVHHHYHYGGTSQQSSQYQPPYNYGGYRPRSRYRQGGMYTYGRGRQPQYGRPAPAWCPCRRQWVPRGMECRQPQYRQRRQHRQPMYRGRCPHRDPVLAQRFCGGPRHGYRSRREPDVFQWYRQYRRRHDYGQPRRQLRLHNGHMHQHPYGRRSYH